jgi:hypothetical protein
MTLGMATGHRAIRERAIASRLKSSLHADGASDSLTL